MLNHFEQLTYISQHMILKTRLNPLDMRSDLLWCLFQTRGIAELHFNMTQKT